MSMNFSSENDIERLLYEYVTDRPMLGCASEDVDDFRYFLENISEDDDLSTMTLESAKEKYVGGRINGGIK